MLERRKKVKLVINIILIICFLALIVFIAIKFGPYIVKLASKPEQLKNMLVSYGWKGDLVFIFIQLLQVVVAAIPGEVVQLAGGYIYGTWLGTFYSLTGIVLGSVVVFYISRLLGFTIVKTFVSQKSLDKFDFIMNSEKSEFAMFLLFLIPGIPKDILTYIAGLTPIKPLKFFIIITIARFPALLASSYIGYSTQKGNYMIVIILCAAAVVLFTTGIFMKDRILKLIKNLK
jgi:uncharacterized membrane protein YdjX (TVP38/TMEM64 family)